MTPTSPSFEAPQQRVSGSGLDGSNSGLSRSRRAILWLLVAAACALYIYRINTFTPQPLDSSNTLRPILNRWFIAFLRLYAHPEPALAAWKNFCAIVLFIPPVLAMLDFVREHGMLNLPDRAARALCSRTLLFVSSAISLTACRYPAFLTYQLNPDEAQFLAAAHKLFWDGNFFRSVDTGTSGPLNIYPLTLPSLFGFSPDYASSRVLALIYVFGIIYLLYRTVRLLASESIARIAIVPVVVTFAVFRCPDYVQYSSEQMPVLIVSAALYASVSVLAHPSAHRMPLVVLGLLSSAAFFSKMQSVPIVATMAAVAIAYTHASGNERRFWRPTALFIAGTTPLLFLNAALCWTGGVWRDFWMSYIVTNLRYSEIQTDFVRDLSRFVQYLVGTFEVRLFLLAFLALGVAFVIQSSRSDQKNQPSAFLKLCIASAIVITAADRLQSSEASTLRGYLALFAMIAVPLYFLFVHRARPFEADPVRWFGLLATFSIAAALYSIYKPHRPFPHYLLFLYVPMFAAMAWMLMRQVGSGTAKHARAISERFRGPQSVAPFAFVFLFVALAVTNAECIWGFQWDQEYGPVIATVSPPEGDFIRSLTSPDGQIMVWGWTTDPYLGSGRVAATRDLNIANLFAAAPEVNSYYHARFLQDLSKNPPELLVDAIGPTSFLFQDRAGYNFEQFPDLAAFVALHYIHVTDGYGQRYYLRRDLAAKNRSITLPKTCAAEALRCLDAPLRNHAANAALLDVAKTLAPVEMPAHALIEAQFTPAGAQTENATVFNNEAVPRSYRGFRLQNIGGDRYQLVLGLGKQWAFSKSFLLPQGKKAFVSIEMNGKEVSIRANGISVDDMHLPLAMTDAPGPITVGSWINGYCRLWGTIEFFQIVDLAKKTQSGS